MSNFSFILTERDGTEIGELNNALDRKIEVNLKRPATAGFRLRTADPLLPELYAADRLLKVYHYLPPTNTTELLFHGPITTLELNTVDQQGASVAATAADPAFFFTKRVMGRSEHWTSGYEGILYNGWDKIDLVEDLIENYANWAGETGVRVLGTVNSGTTAVYVVPPYKLLDEVMAELTDTLDGFDWYIRPIEYDAGKIGEFVAEAVVGELKSNAVFEYGPGTRANLREFNYQRMWTDLANHVYNVPGDLQAENVLTDSDAASKVDHGLYEAVVDSGELSNEALRNEVTDFHIQLRKDPRNILTFIPAVDPDEHAAQVPVFGHDYSVGDLVPVRIAPEGHTLIGGNVRIWRMTIEIDQNGRVTYTPTTVPEE